MRSASVRTTYNNSVTFALSDSHHNQGIFIYPYYWLYTPEGLITPHSRAFMMTEGSICALLRPSEYLKAFLETVVMRHTGVEAVEGKSTKEKALEHLDAEDAKIIAVVAHRSAQPVSEEGSVFICTSTAEDGTPQELDIESVFPLTTDFSIAISQTKRKSTNPSIEKENTGFSLTINPGRSLDPDIEYQPINLFTNDVKGLRHFLVECKALTKVEDDSENVSALRLERPFQWLSPYSSDRELPRLFSLVPQDLRMVKQPIHARLSIAVAGLPSDDLADFKLIRDEWIQTHARKASRKGRHKLRVRLGTFNVNGKLPSQDLSVWITSHASSATLIDDAFIPPLEKVLPIPLGDVGGSLFSFWRSPPPQDNPATSSLPGSSNTEELDPDLFVLGFQELDLSAEALVYSTGTAREDAWCQAIFAALGEKRDLYQKLISKQLVGMLIILISKKSLVSCFSDVQTAATGAGIMGMMGNKGGTAIRLQFTPPAPEMVDVVTSGPTTLTFVNAHLAAFDEMYDKRNLDFQDLSKRLKFVSEVVDATGPASMHVSAYESDVLFWMGDLNYRIDLPDEDIRNILATDKWKGRYETLLDHDQLKKAAHTRQAFADFSEYPITHLPTYRFSSGLEKDALGYDSKRKPAWTDRILHITGPNVKLRQLSYTGHHQITMSDHRPLAADFLLGVNVYDKKVQKDVGRKLYRAVARMEDFPVRIIKLDKTVVNMGIIGYKRSSSRILHLQNTGKGPCAYRFVHVDPDTAIHPEWLSIEPMQAIILPGESAQITLTSYVDKRTAAKLNLCEKRLETTLILHTILGKDHFINVTAEYQYTCFSNKLSRLARLPGPIRSLKSPDDLRSEDHPINAPREIMRLVNWMMSYHGSIDGLFTSSADESIIATIRECLDTGNEFPFSQPDVHLPVLLAFGETLLLLLDSLVDAVVPSHLHSKCVQAMSRDEAFELLDTFPPVSVNVWISITAFLHFICQSPSDGEEASERAGRIAAIFAPVLLRDERDSGVPTVSPLGKRKFLLYFIT